MIKQCVVCGKEFVSPTKAKVCGSKCREVYYRRVYRKTNAAYNETLCWSCKKAIRGCSWSRSFTPVEGWTAEPTKIKIRSDGGGGYIDSYKVIECPEYIKDN